MSRPQRIEYPGALYHVTSRGNEKGAIFWEDRDRRKFLSLIDAAHQRYEILLHAYLLMPNHYHLLIETPRGNLARVMHDLNGVYTGYVNAVRKRTGHLFQGRYKAIVVEKDRYLLELSRYIHLNPVRAGLVKLPGQYAWSGVHYLLGAADATAWFDADFTLRMFAESRRDARAAYREFLRQGLEKKSPLEDVYAQCMLGSTSFIAAVKSAWMQDDRIGRDVVRAKSLSRKATLDSIRDLVAGEAGPNEQPFPRPGTRKDHLGVKLFIYLARRYTDKTLRDIADYLGWMNANAVSQAHFTFKRRLERDKTIQATVARLEQALR